MNLLGNVDIRSRAIFGMEIWLLDEADEREIWNGNGMEITRRYASSPPPPPPPPGARV